MRRTRVGFIALLVLGLLMGSTGAAPAAPAPLRLTAGGRRRRQLGQGDALPRRPARADGGHLPPVQKNVDLVGFTDLFAGQEQPGRIGDVSAKGNHAYLTLFYEPECDRSG